MRDRREALKLLTGGTAAALGASIITTSTAFADSGTTSCPPTGPVPVLSATWSLDPVTQGNSAGQRTNAVQVRLNGGGVLSIPAMACPDCVPGVTPDPSRQFRWSFDEDTDNDGIYAVSSSTNASALTSFRLYNAATNGTAYAGFTPLPTGPGNVSFSATTVWVRPTTGNFQDANRDPIDFTVRLTIRWICDNSQVGTNRKGWKCTSFAISFRWSANGSNPDTAVSQSTSGPEIGPTCELSISAN